MGDAKLFIIAVAVSLIIGTFLPMMVSPFANIQSNDISQYSGIFGQVVGGGTSSGSSTDPNIAQGTQQGLLCTSLGIGCQPLYNTTTTQNSTGYSITSTTFFGAFAILTNPLAIIGGSSQNYAAQSIAAWNLLPVWLSVPVVIVLNLLLIIGLYKVISPFT